MAKDPINMQAHLAEYNALRAEILSRVQLSTNLVLAQMTLLGVVAPFADKRPDVLLGLAMASSVLWLAWIEVEQGIFKIAAYIGIILTRKLSLPSSYAFSWEEFWRTIEQKESKRKYANFPADAHDAMRSIKILPNWTTQSIVILFGPLQFLLLVSYFVLLHKRNIHFDWYRGGLFGIAFASLAYAFIQFWKHTKGRISISKAIQGIQMQAPNTETQVTLAALKFDQHQS